MRFDMLSSLSHTVNAGTYDQASLQYGFVTKYPLQLNSMSQTQTEVLMQLMNEVGRLAAASR